MISLQDIIRIIGFIRYYVWMDDESYTVTDPDEMLYLFSIDTGEIFPPSELRTVKVDSEKHMYYIDDEVYPMYNENNEYIGYMFYDGVVDDI